MHNKLKTELFYPLQFYKDLHRYKPANVICQLLLYTEILLCAQGKFLTYGKNA